MKLLFKTFQSLFILSIFAVQVVFALELPQQKRLEIHQDLPEIEGVELVDFALAPHVNYPVSVVASPQGHVYAFLDKNAGTGAKANMGKIVRLVDHDNDGQADEMTDYVPNIDSPRGGCFIGDTLYVMHPPFVSAFKDVDGNGVADEQTILVKGLAHDYKTLGRQDHTANDVRMGVDGWLYLALGDFGANATGTDGSRVSLRAGGVLRVKPDGSQLELFSQGLRNIYDVAVSPKMTLLARDNTNDGDGWDMRVFDVVQHAHYGYPNLYKFFKEDTMLPIQDGGSGSGVGAIYLQEPGFPEVLNDRFWTISWGRVFTHSLEQIEATYKNHETLAFKLTKTVDLDVDGSSRLYFANFDGGGAKPNLENVGRVVRMVPKGWKYEPFPNLSKMSLKELVECFDKGSHVLRLNAQAELRKRKTQSSVADLKVMIENSAASMDGRIAALFALKQISGKLSHEYLLGKLSDPQLVEYALLCLQNDKQEMQGLQVKDFEPYLKNNNPRVVLRTLQALSALGKREAFAPMLNLASKGREFQGDDKHAREVLPHIAQQAMATMDYKDYAYQQLSNDDLYEKSLGLLRQDHQVETVEAIIKAIDKRANKMPYLIALMRLYHREKAWDGKSWWKTRPYSKGPYYEKETWEGTAFIKKVLETEANKLNPKAQAEFLNQLRRHQIETDQLNLKIEVDEFTTILDADQANETAMPTLMQGILERDLLESDFRRAVMVLMNLKGVQQSAWLNSCYEIIEMTAIKYPSRLNWVKDQFYQSPIQREGMFNRKIKNIVRNKKASNLIKSLSCQNFFNLIDNPLIEKSNLELLQRSTPQLIPYVNVEVLKSLDLSSPSFRKFLNQLKSDKSIKQDLKAVSTELLSQVSQESSKLVGSEKYQNLQKEMKHMRGDSEQGKVFFTRQGCAVCHTTSPNELQKGPYLGAVSTQFTRNELIQHIVDPSSEVAQGFQTSWFKLKDNSTMEGFVIKRDSKQIKMRNTMGIAFEVETEKVVDEGIRENSMMPDGLVSSLSLKEFASLLDYLETLH